MLDSTKCPPQADILGSSKQLGAAVLLFVIWHSTILEAYSRLSEFSTIYIQLKCAC
jgi:hypothetical protein